MFYTALVQVAMAMNAKNVKSGGPGSDPSPLSDVPLNDATGDLLNRTGYAKALASTIRRLPSTECVVIGIAGPWGSGKCSLVNMVFGLLKEDKAVQLIRISPWQYANVESAMVGLLWAMSNQAGLPFCKKQLFTKRVLSRFIRAASLSSTPEFKEKISALLPGLILVLASTGIDVEQSRLLHDVFKWVGFGGIILSILHTTYNHIFNDPSLQPVSGTL